MERFIEGAWKLFVMHYLQVIRFRKTNFEYYSISNK